MAQIQESGGTGKGAAKKAPDAQFEISIDGTPRTYRDRKAFAIEAPEHLKRKRA